MWISKRKWEVLERRISALEKIEKERRDLKQRQEEHGEEALKRAKELLRLGSE